MPRSTRTSQPFLELIFPLLILGSLILYTYAKFTQIPFAGFRYKSSGQIVVLYVHPPSKPTLELGDQLVQIGPVPWKTYQGNLHQTLFDKVQPGDSVDIVIERQISQQPIQQTIHWVFPGFNQEEFLQRLNSEWFLAYFFWLFGTLTFLLVRPRDERWWLLILFNYVTAIWLCVGGLSLWHTWNSALILRSTLWLALPIYWHLHWVFPQSLGPVPARGWWILYFFGALLATLQWLQILPGSLYYLVLLLAILGSVGLLVAHSILQPDRRRDLSIMILAVGLAILPAVTIALIGLIAEPPWGAAGSLLSLPFFPALYFYLIYRRQLGGLEVRVNRLVSLFSFLILLGTSLVILITFAHRLAFSSAILSFSDLLIYFTAVVVGIFSFQPFEKFFERQVLGIPLPHTQLLEIYTSRITVSLDTASLIKLLRDEILPSLLIRQSILYRFDGTLPETLYSLGIKPHELPGDLSPLIVEAGKYRLPLTRSPQPQAWIRLSLILSVDQKPLGLWLLGRRDPDDYYSQRDIEILQSLANQTAIALTNIVQAERLRALYQDNIERGEVERLHLARELHDDILNDLGLLKLKLNTSQNYASLVADTNLIITRLRDITQDLRPAMLTQGLGYALTGLVDEISQRVEPLGISVCLKLEGADTRYPSRMELHLYRIVQQACENALKHGAPKTLTVRGRLTPEIIDLTIEDDGTGFDLGPQLDLAKLVARKHFGLAGIYERAALVGADLRLDSAPGQGTRVYLKWAANPEQSNP